ncbi:MAG: adenylate/guanylate cyclase domain-containing protein [Deltaproteobacteria bacterium]|nr:MAG: adenylate/guanylate cyclase domain-containing protein [Deltaproteobacteria bacterium]
MAGERLTNRIRFVYGTLGLLMAIAAADINTPAANRIFLLQGILLLTACGVLFLFFRSNRDRYVPWLKYVTIAFDIGVVHLAALACDANHSGVIEYFDSFFPLVLVLWTMAAGLRYNVAACIYATFVTATLSSLVLWWVVSTARVEVATQSVWGVNAINIADETMRIVFMSMSGLAAAVLASIARRLMRRAHQESRNRAALQRQKDRLSKYLGEELADAVVGDDSGFELGGSKRPATILFTDIRNFTAMSQGTDAAEIVRLLNEYFTEMVDIVFRYGGTLDKFVGDGLMAVYGAPFDRDHAPLRAVLTALEMVAAVRRRRFEVGNVASGLRIGAGIASGTVIAGNIGSMQRMEYTVIGDAVNLAARLENLNRDLGTSIIIDRETRDAIAPWIPAQALPPIKIRGITGEQQLYTIDPATVPETIIERLRTQVLQNDAATLDGPPPMAEETASH